jgi:hypothetical protein
VLVDIPLDRLDRPVGQRDDPFAIVLGQCKYVDAAESLNLSSDSEYFLVKVEVFKGNTEEFAFPHPAGNRQFW